MIQTSAFGQTYRGSVRGTITDNQRAPIAGVSVKLTSVETGEVRRATTGDEGEFTVSSLPPSEYRLEVEQANFKKHTELLTLRVNQSLRLNVALELGPISEEI